MNRRHFLSSLGATPLAFQRSGERGTESQTLPPAIQALTPMTAGIVPITVEERKARIAKAQRLMEEQKIDAIFMEGGTSCFYFVGMRWGMSERTFGVVIPAKGGIAYVCPGFEEDRARELIKPAFGDEVRVWQEDESPYKVIAQIVTDRGVRFRRIGIEERVRFFVADGIRRDSGLEIVDATPVTAGCRMIKSPAEIALMQRANDATLAAYKAALSTHARGHDPGRARAATSSRPSPRLGFRGDVSAQFGKWTGPPARQRHAATPARRRRRDDRRRGHVRRLSVSDITRTTVFGKPTQRQIDVWEIEKRAQAAAFKAITIGAHARAWTPPRAR